MMRVRKSDLEYNLKRSSRGGSEEVFPPSISLGHISNRLAQNLGVKNALWDKKQGYASPRACYNSYFFKPDDESLSVIDKMQMHGEKIVQYLDGGSACHINLQEHLTKQQYRKLLTIAAKLGCSYFTFNIPNTICDDCGHISKHYTKTCPKCGSEKIDWITRIIGYAKRISKWSDPRKEQGAARYYDSKVD